MPKSNSKIIYYVNTKTGSYPLWTRTSKIPIENIFNPYTDDQLWLMIPDYPGYEISSLMNIRSFKYKNQFKYGALIKIDASGTCYLSDKNNCRVKENVDSLYNKAVEFQKKYRPSEYPRRTCQIYPKFSSRNKRAFINHKEIRESDKLIVHKPKPIRGVDNSTLSMVSFAGLFEKKKIIDPIYFYPNFIKINDKDNN